MTDQQQKVDNSSNSQNQQTMNGKTPAENIQENAEWKTYTLSHVAKTGTGLVVEELGDDNYWLNFESEYLVDQTKEELKSDLQDLNQNKDQWGEPIQLKMLNKGTETEPEFIFINYRIPNEDQLPDDFEKAESDDSSNSSGSGQRSDSSDSMGDVQYDEIIETLQEVTDGDYDITTDILDVPREEVVVRAIIEYNVDDQENKVNAHGTSADSQMKQKVEHAETRAIKRAVKHSGILKRDNGGDE